MQMTNDDTSERRFEVSCKLEAELAALDALKDAEQQSKKLTNGMVNILSSLEDRLARLRRTILPVYNETGNLQTQQQSKCAHFILIFNTVFEKNKKFNYCIQTELYLQTLKEH